MNEKCDHNQERFINSILHKCQGFTILKSPESSPDVTSPSPAWSPIQTHTVLGVSIGFLHQFVKDNSISKSMLTSEVVKGIIIPQTLESKESYVNGVMIVNSEKSEQISDLRKGF